MEDLGGPCPSKGTKEDMPTNVRTEWKSGCWEGSGPIRHAWHDGLLGYMATTDLGVTGLKE